MTVSISDWNKRHFPVVATYKPEPPVLTDTAQAKNGRFKQKLIPEGHEVTGNSEIYTALDLL